MPQGRRHARILATALTALFMFGAQYTVAAEEVGRGGTLTVVPGAPQETLDMASRTSAPAASMVRLIAEPLIDRTPDGEFVAGLATDWSVADDGETWTFTLRQGVVFHDGTPFTAEAVKRTFERHLDETKEGVGDRVTEWRTRIQSVNVVDDYTVEIVTPGPYGPFLTVMSETTAIINHPTQPSGEIRHSLIGTGPYRLESWDPGEELLLVANDNYWGGEQYPGPYLDRIVAKEIVESATAVAMLEAGEVDAIFDVPLADVNRLDDDPNIVLDLRPSTRTKLLEFNLTKEPLNIPEVREAIDLALDNEALADGVLRGLAVPAESFQAEGIPGFCAVPNYQQFDPERSRQLLAEAGVPDGFDVNLMYGVGRYPMDREIAVTIQSFLADVGINVNIEARDWGDWLDIHRLPAEESIYQMKQWAIAQPDVGVFADRWLHSGSHVPEGTNATFYENARVDELLEQARVEPDPELRTELLCEVQQIVAEERPMLGLFVYQQLAAWQPNVQGVEIWPGEEFRLDSVRFGD